MNAAQAPCLAKDRRGVAALEFAIVAPLLIVLLWGAISYGGYFMLSHNVQQIANDAARAAIAGLDDDERRALAADCVQREAAALPFAAKRPALSIGVQTSGDTYAVTVTYDASRSPFFAFAQLGPMPSPRIGHTGTILLGGF